jgi:hypothetical protein
MCTPPPRRHNDNHSAQRKRNSRIQKQKDVQIAACLILASNCKGIRSVQSPLRRVFSHSLCTSRGVTYLSMRSERLTQGVQVREAHGAGTAHLSVAVRASRRSAIGTRDHRSVFKRRLFIILKHVWERSPEKPNLISELSFESRQRPLRVGAVNR